MWLGICDEGSKESIPCCGNDTVRDRSVAPSARASSAGHPAMLGRASGRSTHNDSASRSKSGPRFSLTRIIFPGWSHSIGALTVGMKKRYFQYSPTEVLSVQITKTHDTIRNSWCRTTRLMPSSFSCKRFPAIQVRDCYMRDSMGENGTVARIHPRARHVRGIGKSCFLNFVNLVMLLTLPRG